MRVMVRVMVMVMMAMGMGIVPVPLPLPVLLLVPISTRKPTIRQGKKARVRESPIPRLHPGLDLDLETVGSEQVHFETRLP